MAQLSIRRAYGDGGRNAQITEGAFEKVGLVHVAGLKRSGSLILQALGEISENPHDLEGDR